MNEQNLNPILKTKPALGRSSRSWLGDFYDCSAEKIISNSKLNPKLDENVNQLCQSSIKYCSFGELYEHLDIDLHSNLYIELGLLEIGGFAESIIKNMSDLKYRPGVFLIHKYETRMEHIQVDKYTPPQMEGAQSLQSGTHLITGITYGCNTIFWTSHQDILKEICHGVESLDDLAQRAKAQSQCKGVIFSDVSSENQDGTLLDALHHMKSVEDILTENQELAAKPLRFHLYPMQKLLGEGIGNTFKEISPCKVSKLLETLHDIQDVDVRGMQLLKRQLWKSSSILTTTITTFRDLCSKNKQEVMDFLQKLIPDIHSGTKDEKELEAFLMMVEDSPFNKKTLNGWIARKEREADKLEEILQIYADIPCLHNHIELKTKLAFHADGEVFCLLIQVPMMDDIVDKMNLHLEQGAADENEADVDLSPLDNSYAYLESKLAIFDDLFKRKQKTSKAKFFIAFEKGDVATLSVVINLYKSKKLVKKDFVPLDIPGQPGVFQITDTSIQLEWQAQCVLGEKEEYRVCIGSPVGDPRFVSTAEHSLLITNLIPETVYQLKICKVQGWMESEYCKYLEVKTKKPDVTSRPPKPICYELSPEKVRLEWAQPERVMQKISSYIIYDAEAEKVMDVDGETTSVEIDLMPNRKYQFSVQADCGRFGNSQHSELCDLFEKKMSEDELRKEKILKSSYLISEEGQSPQIYQLELFDRLFDGIVKRCEFGLPTLGITEKVVMLLGATGSGKTKLVNGMANYILGTKWEDDFRIRLIPEEEKAANQAQSQTSMITAYTIHYQKGCPFPYTVTLVDTPGFGDTSGILKDQEIISKIDWFFRDGCRLDHIDVVGFVAQSSLARLTPTQRYIFDSILSLFGKDIEENIVPLLTFADAHPPQVLSAFKEAHIPSAKYFKFNNSAVYADNKGDTKVYDKMFWEIGERSFGELLDAIQLVTPKSLMLTKEVLSERETLQLQVEEINKDVNHGLNKLDMLTREYGILKGHEDDIAKNENFTYTVFEEIQELESIPEGKYTTNCISCKKTCHFPCTRKEDADKVKCAMMRKNGLCKKCTCSWKLHRNLPHRYVILRKEVEKTYDGLKERYQIAQDEKKSHEKILEGITKDFYEKRVEIAKKTMEVRRCITRLHEIALKPNPLSTAEYVQMMIDAEKYEALPGWYDRCTQLYNVKKTAVFIEKLMIKGYDPFKDHDEILMKVRERSQRNPVPKFFRKIQNVVHGSGFAEK